MTETLDLNSIVNVSEQPVNFSPRELKLFIREIADMIVAGEPIDAEKAIHNAQYFAEIDRLLENIDAGKNLVTFTSEEWEKFSNSHNV